MSPPRSLVICINHPDEIVKQTLLEFVGDQGNQAAGFDSADDLRARLAQTNTKADAVIASQESISNVDADSIAHLSTDAPATPDGRADPDHQWRH